MVRIKRYVGLEVGNLPIQICDSKNGVNEKLDIQNYEGGEDLYLLLLQAPNTEESDIELSDDEELDEFLSGKWQM